MGKLKKKLFDEIVVNTWIFFNSFFIIFVFALRILIEKSEISTDKFDLLFVHNTIVYFIYIPYAIYLLGYIILRIIGIRANLKLTFMHFIFFMLPFVLIKIYDIDIIVKLFFVVLTFSLYIYNIYKSVLKNEKI